MTLTSLSPSLAQRLILGAMILFLVALAHAHRPTVGESPEARMARRYTAQVSQGQAPEFSFEDVEGVKHTLSDYRGQVVLLNFWASWCPPCLKEMPDLESLARSMRGRPFKLIAVSADESWAEIKSVIGSRPLDMKIFRDHSTTKKRHLIYGTEKLPETYVIDKEGRLRVRLINVQPWKADEIKGYLDWLTDL
jgi:cytochrome c biogenesis protein CcmG, thiol:disulfide interchange protein DsbE